MRILGFDAGGEVRLGVVEGDQVIDLRAIDPKIPSDLGAVLASTNGDLAPVADLAKRAPAAARRPLAGLNYTLPVARPGKIGCLVLNYLDHVREGRYRDDIPKFPTYFMRCVTSLSHESPIIRPRVSETLDYEAELVAIIGKRAKYLTLDNALGCIAGSLA